MREAGKRLTHALTLFAIGAIMVGSAIICSADQGDVSPEGVSWRVVAATCGVIISGICGWVWTSTVKWLAEIAKEMREHIANDNVAFAEVKQMINDNHIETIRAIAEARSRQ